MAGSVSYGSTLSYDGSSIGDIKSIKHSGRERTIATRTPLDTQHALKLPGRVDGGEVTVELYYNETAHGAFWDSLSATLTGTTPPSAKTLIITTPDGTSLTASVYVKSMSGPDADGEDALLASVTFTITGSVTKA